MSDHRDERNPVLVPNRITVEIGLSADTLKLANRALDILDQAPAMRAFTARLNTSSASLASVVAAHPDPDTTD